MFLFKQGLYSGTWDTHILVVIITFPNGQLAVKKQIYTILEVNNFLGKVQINAIFLIDAHIIAHIILICSFI